MDEFKQEDILLDQALNQLPFAPLPPDFVNQVMAALETADAYSATSPAPIRFRLQFLDVALALFWSATLAIIWLTILWWTGILQFNWLPVTQIDFEFIDQFSMLNPTMLIAGTMLFLLEISLLGLIGMNLLGERPS